MASFEDVKKSGTPEYQTDGQLRKTKFSTSFAPTTKLSRHWA